MPKRRSGETEAAGQGPDERPRLGKKQRNLEIQKMLEVCGVVHDNLMQGGSAQLPAGPWKLTDVFDESNERVRLKKPFQDLIKSLFPRSHFSGGRIGSHYSTTESESASRRKTTLTHLLNFLFWRCYDLNLRGEPELSQSRKDIDDIIFVLHKCATFRPAYGQLATAGRTLCDEIIDSNPDLKTSLPRGDTRRSQIGVEAIDCICRKKKILGSEFDASHERRPVSQSISLTVYLFDEIDDVISFCRRAVGLPPLPSDPAAVEREVLSLDDVPTRTAPYQWKDLFSISNPSDRDRRVRSTAPLILLLAYGSSGPPTNEKRVEINLPDDALEAILQLSNFISDQLDLFFDPNLSIGILQRQKPESPPLVKTLICRLLGYVDLMPSHREICSYFSGKTLHDLILEEEEGGRIPRGRIPIGHPSRPKLGKLAKERICDKEFDRSHPRVPVSYSRHLFCAYLKNEESIVRELIREEVERLIREEVDRLAWEFLN
jgi:hypothetical protein